MGLDNVKQAGVKLDPIIETAKAFISFVNVNEGVIVELRNTFGKALDVVTDAEIREYVGEQGAVLTQETIDNIRMVFDVFEDLIQIVKPIRNKLPANDLKD